MATGTAFTNSLENALLDYLLRNVSTNMPTPIATPYVALGTDTTPADGTFTEVSGGSYARQGMAFSAASVGAITNSGVVTFPQATANWGIVSEFGLANHLSNVMTGTAGMFWGALTATVTINTNDTFEFAAGAVDIDLD